MNDWDTPVTDEDRAMWAKNIQETGVAYMSAQDWRDFIKRNEEAIAESRRRDPEFAARLDKMSIVDLYGLYIELLKIELSRPLIDEDTKRSLEYDLNLAQGAQRYYRDGPTKRPRKTRRRLSDPVAASPRSNGAAPYPLPDKGPVVATHRSGQPGPTQPAQGQTASVRPPVPRAAPKREPKPDYAVYAGKCFGVGHR